jgi:hypothetical protein
VEEVERLPRRVSGLELRELAVGHLSEAPDHGLGHAPIHTGLGRWTGDGFMPVRSMW